MTFSDYLHKGLPLADELVIDAHAHMGNWYNFHIPGGGTADTMVAAMDRLGIDKTIIAPHICIGPDYCRGNRDAAEAARRYPDRLIPFVAVNPNYPQEEIEAEISHFEQSGGIKAFKIHPECHKAPACHKNYYPVFEYCQKHGLPILSHNWTGGEVNGKNTLHGLAEAFPNVSFIVAHAASSWDVIDVNCEAAGLYENIYLDLTGSPLFYDAVPEMVRRVGAERILFGTDNPFIDPRPGLGRMLAARIKDDEKRLILGHNARRIFKI